MEEVNPRILELIGLGAYLLIRAVTLLTWPWSSDRSNATRERTLDGVWTDSRKEGEEASGGCWAWRGKND
jgi:hypothetical protein